MSCNNEEYNLLSGCLGFDEANQGIVNVLQNTFNLRFNIPVSNENVNSVFDTVKFIYNLGGERFLISYADLDNLGLNEFVKQIEKIINSDFDISISFSEFPFCLFSKNSFDLFFNKGKVFLDDSEKIILENVNFKSNAWKKIIFENFVEFDECRKCKFYFLCPKIPKELIDDYKIEPIKD
jgi:hypothetical protein